MPKKILQLPGADPDPLETKKGSLFSGINLGKFTNFSNRGPNLKVIKHGETTRKVKTKVKPKPKKKVTAKPKNTLKLDSDFNIDGKLLRHVVGLAKGAVDKMNDFNPVLMFKSNPFPVVFFGGKEISFWYNLPPELAEFKKPVVIALGVCEDLGRQQFVEMDQSGDVGNTRPSDGVRGKTVLVEWLDTATAPPKIPKNRWVNCPGLGEAIQVAVPSSAPEKTNYALNGVLISGDDGCVVATDGKQMVILECDFEFEGAYIIPGMKFFKTKSPLNIVPDLKFAIKGSRVFLQTPGGELTVAAKTVEGHFPPYQEVVPDPYNSDWSVQMEDNFLKKIRRLIRDEKHSVNEKALIRFEPRKWTFSRIIEDHTANGKRIYGPDISVECMHRGLDSPTYQVHISRIFFDRIMKWPVQDVWCTRADCPVLFGGKTASGINFKHVVMPVNTL